MPDPTCVFIFTTSAARLSWETSERRTAPSGIPGTSDVQAWALLGYPRAPVHINKITVELRGKKVTPPVRTVTRTPTNGRDRQKRTFPRSGQPEISISRWASLTSSHGDVKRTFANFTRLHMLQNNTAFAVHGTIVYL
ncbi:uncharacterized protein LOC118414148 isoform X2 [Branchiostoma floridae]|uniref:Uncharacterized protein LOC118414148 isoform X1 n=1 Tax=Branchiostoma floridae TaxID=7739 RepID=A0A9J7L2A6_BRAFL|nr:uncharacterized protein LOC118414148 isoform X1 [Branchiostoma floridae]XP_035673874.1 uncharacterized protein LOC118414148 isoform X2 [Branchiostoma floridae]